jgi:hypothetical protein
MIASLSEEPLQKITLNLFRRDYEELQRIYGQGYSTEIRKLVRKHLKERRQQNA